MNEGMKTGIFAGVAGVAVVLAVAMSWSGSQASVTPDDEIGQTLFEDSDANKATSLEIVKFDSETHELRDFRVAKTKGLWTIPSHYNYPADAAEHLAKAANSILGLKKLNVVGDQKSMQETFGVIAPDSKSVDAGDEGIGTLVVLMDEGGNKLAQLVIGKEVKDKPDLRYVRIPDKERIYTVKLSTADLSTDFADWIEDDLLKLNAFDIAGVKIQDYTINELEMTQSEVDLVDLKYDDAASGDKWSMAKMPEGMKLNDTKLNDMRTALDDLKIVDVRRKPQGLRSALAGEGTRLSPQDAISLQQHGFFLANGGLFSSEGEVICDMKDGLAYELRFGRITAKTAEQKEKEKEKDAGGDDQEEPAAEEDPNAEGSGLNRYIFVTARFDETLIEKPQLEPLPGEKPAVEVNKPEGDAKPEGSDKPESSKDGEETPQPTKPDAKPAGSDGDSSDADTEADEAEADDAANQDAEASEQPAAPAGPKPDAEASDEDKVLREQIEKENKRKMDEYQEKVKRGTEHAQELNNRFADWYYVISDEVYRKIHLSRSEILEPIEPAAEPETDPATENDPVRQLEAIKNQGLKP